MKKIILAYIPVIHQGYVKFLKKHDADHVFLFDQKLLEECEWLRKDIRALKPADVAKSLNVLLKSENVETISAEELQDLIEKTGQNIIMPDEDVSHLIAEKYLRKTKVTYDKVFLRWEKNNVVAEHELKPEKTFSGKDFHQKMMLHAENLAEYSEDWWRQVGGIIAKDEEVLLAAFNQHVPDQYQTAFAGDPRASFKKGLNIELSTAFHAEASLIASAAKQGVSLEGAELYVTTFPCPPCAKLIAYSGIKTLYFKEGYSMVDGESILKEKGVEVIQVK